jgi:hypothetical protein
MSYADFICAYWQLLIGYALIPIALIFVAFVLCRADRRGQVKQMHRMRQQH